MKAALDPFGRVADVVQPSCGNETLAVDNRYGSDLRSALRNGLHVPPASWYGGRQCALSQSPCFVDNHQLEG
jgi:hypothetical protein